MENKLDKEMQEKIDSLFDRISNKEKVNKEKIDIAEDNSKNVDEVNKKWTMNEKIIELFINNIKGDNGLKEKYAIILIVILIAQLIALNVLFILVGCGVLSYSETTFNIFITGGILEVFVLVRVIVKYLFKDNLTNALNIILEKNNSKENFKN